MITTTMETVIKARRRKQHKRSYTDGLTRQRTVDNIISKGVSLKFVTVEYLENVSILFFACSVNYEYEFEHIYFSCKQIYLRHNL